MKMGLERERLIGRLNDAADQQPWRCVGCGTAIRINTNQPCRCWPETSKEKEESRKT